MRLLAAPLLVIVAVASDSGCQPEYVACASSGDCARDQVCFENMCRTVCNTSSDCARGDVCFQGACVPQRDVAHRDAALPDLAAADRSAVDRATAPDTGSDDRARRDAGPPDAAPADAAPADAAVGDAAGADRARADSAPPDAGLVDAQARDSALPDTLRPDQARPDASVADAVAPDTAAPDAALPDAAPLDACVPPLGPGWWDSAYLYRFALLVGGAPEQYTVELVLSGANADTVWQRSSVDGRDLRVVHHGATAREIDRELLAFDSDSVVARFMIQESGGWPGGEQTYYLYIGNVLAGEPPHDLHNVYLFFEDFEDFALGADGTGVFNPLPSGAWQIVDDGGNKVYFTQHATRTSAEIVGHATPDAALEARFKWVAFGGAYDALNLFFRASTLVPASVTGYNGCVRAASSTAGISSHTNGTWSDFLSSSSHTAATGTWYHLEALFVGSHSQFSVDGFEMGAIETTPTDAALIGLGGYDVDGYYDDVKLRRVQLPAPEAHIGVVEQRCQ